MADRTSSSLTENVTRLARLAMVVTLTLSLSSDLTAQQRDDFIRPFFGFYDSQSLATAIGNATVASGQVIPGRSSNPANLGLNRFNNVQLNFQHNSFTNPDASVSNTRIGGAYGIFPVPVYQGSLVFSLGIQRVIDFSNAYATANRTASEEGGIYATELGVSFEAAENLFVGGALQILRGSDELSNTESDTSTLLNPVYKGSYISLGFVNRTTDHFQIGASVNFPTKVDVHEDLTVWPTSTPFNSTTSTWNYKLTRPLGFHAGFSLLYPLYSVFYELEWTDWQDLEFASSEYNEGDIAQINRDIKRDFRSTLSHHIGGAHHLPQIPLHLYAGYQYLPVAFTGVYDGNARQALSCGGSYMLSQQFSVHTSLSHYFWDYQGASEKFNMFIFGSSFHF